MKIRQGQKAPDFKLPDQSGEHRTLSDFKGRWVLLYFYPKDDTPGCTAEACGLRDAMTDYRKKGVEIIGISVDSVDSHEKFVKKYQLPFTVLSDELKEAVALYGVWGKKKFMGREYMGTNRVSFLIDPSGAVARIYPKVKPAEHAQQVLADVEEIIREYSA